MGSVLFILCINYIFKHISYGEIFIYADDLDMVYSNKEQFGSVSEDRINFEISYIYLKLASKYITKQMFYLTIVFLYDLSLSVSGNIFLKIMLNVNRIFFNLVFLISSKLFRKTSVNHFFVLALFLEILFSLTCIANSLLPLSVLFSEWTGVSSFSPKPTQMFVCSHGNLTKQLYCWHGDRFGEFNNLPLKSIWQ